MNLFELLLNKANAIEIDDHFFRWFDIDDDGMYTVTEDGDRDAIVVHAEMIDDDFNKWEYFLTYNQLVEAQRNNDGSWVIDYNGELLYITAFNVEIV